MLAWALARFAPAFFTSHPPFGFGTTCRELIASTSLCASFNGATALPGLVIVLAMSFTTMAPAAMRATVVAYFIASDAVVLGLLAADGSIGASLPVRVAAGMPLLGLGIYLGSKAFRRSSAETFRRVTLGLLIVVSIVGLVRTVIA